MAAWAATATPTYSESLSERPKWQRRPSTRRPSRAAPALQMENGATAVQGWEADAKLASSGRFSVPCTTFPRPLALQF